MKRLYDQLSSRVSIAVTKEYSTSFSLAIRCVHKSMRPAIYKIYGFVRLADEIVDSFEGFDKAALLRKYREDTWQAIHQRISLNPVLHAFQEVVHEYGIQAEEINSFLDSMEMDLYLSQHDQNTIDRYILGSAEVVGFMCLRVFTHTQSHLFDELKPYAMKLGSVFQKINFLRDIQNDYSLLGRTYFPSVQMHSFTAEVKETIEDEIQEEFHQAMEGIKKLPVTSRSGVYLACVYYKALFKKIRRLPPHRIMNERVRIPNGKKFGLLVNTYFQNKLNVL